MDAVWHTLVDTVQSTHSRLVLRCLRLSVHRSGFPQKKKKKTAEGQIPARGTDAVAVARGVWRRYGASFALECSALTRARIDEELGAPEARSTCHALPSGGFRCASRTRAHLSGLGACG